jgi:DNA-directed RNA polymerase subunit RPC12/RpoP
MTSKSDSISGENKCGQLFCTNSVIRPTGKVSCADPNNSRCSSCTELSKHYVCNRCNEIFSDIQELYDPICYICISKVKIPVFKK